LIDDVLVAVLCRIDNLTVPDIAIKDCFPQIFVEGLIVYP
jgi:hypothetical protein